MKQLINYFNELETWRFRDVFKFVRLPLLLVLLLVLGKGEVNAQELKTGEYAVQADGSPAIVGQCVQDHFFVRNVYNDIGANTTYDNLISFKSGSTQIVAFYLDDDQIYTNEAVQGLTPVPWADGGSEPYQEITYNCAQFSIYLPIGMSLIKYIFPGGQYAVEYKAGDRMPYDASVSWTKKEETKTVDGIEYNVYIVLVTNQKNDACHFSGNQNVYAESGAQKKDDCPMFFLAIENTNQEEVEGRLADMILANQEFGIREANINWGTDPNLCRYIYGTGGNNVEQRFQLYTRISLYGSAGILGQVFVVNGIYYIFNGDNTVSVTNRRDGSFYNGNIIIPQNVYYNGVNYTVTSIGDNAFQGSSGLTSVTIPQSVNSVGYDAFRGCTSLTRVNTSDLAAWCRINFGNASANPLYYAQHLYVENNEVTDLVVPNEVYIIGDYAFFNCSLTSVKFHKSVISVGKQAFNNSAAIGTVTCGATTPPSWDDIAMFTTNVYNHTSLYVPLGCERAYMSDQCWGQFSTIIGTEIQDEVLATGISLNKSQMSLQLGDNSQLVATIMPDSTTNKMVNWLSSDPAVAGVDENGLVTALAVGNATITATTTDGSNLSASCGVTVTEDLSEYDNYLSLNDVEAFRGDTIVIPIAMTNAESIIAFQTDIFLPDGLEILQEDGEFLIDPSDRMTRTHSIMSNEISNGAIRVICYSSNYKPFTGNSGDDLFYITVKVADDAEGDYIIQLKNTLFTTSEFEEIAAPDVAATVNVKAYLLGDANGSGTVTVTDVVVTSKYILEMNPNPFIFEAADVNIDGNITVTDVSRIAWIVLNPTLTAPHRAPALWNNGDRMSSKDIAFVVGETRTVSIALDNEMDYSAFQLDLTLPEGLTASNFHLTNRAGSHAFDVNTLANGKIRALCYSPALTAIRGNEGALLTFDVTAIDNVKGDITVNEIELVTTDCQTVKLDAFTIGVTNASSVNEITSGKTIARVDYFNVAGQRLDRPESGVTLVVTTYTDGTRPTTKILK